MFQEKRRFPRQALSSALRYEQKGSRRFGNSIARDISKNGLGFISNEFMPISTQLIFEIQRPQGLEIISALGEVVWISNQPHSERFYVGARFLEPITPL